MNKKKEVSIILGLLVIMLSISFVSAGFFDFFKKEPSLAPSQGTDVSITVGNNPPTIPNIQINTNIDLTAGTTTDFNFLFTAEDTNGAADLDDTTAEAVFTRLGEPIRSNLSCDFQSQSGNQRTYNCTVTMQYFDDNGLWDINVSINDLSGAVAENITEDFTVNLLRDITINPATITFPATTQSATNVLSSSNTGIINTGNFDTVNDGNIQVTSENLTGTVTPAEFIPAGNFRAANISDIGTVCSTGGSALDDTVAIGITGSTLPRGFSPNNIGNLTYCITLVPGGISSQSYTANLGGGNQWTIGI